MKLRLLFCMLVALALNVKAQDTIQTPKLVVMITIDQLRSDFLHEFGGLYSETGFKRLLGGGRFYSNGYYAFESIDRASAMATLTTGTNPYVNGIVSSRWLDRNSLRLVDCTEDLAYKGLNTNEAVSPSKMKAIALSDEMKRATRGKSIVCAIAPDADAAVLSGGHAADAVLWKNNETGKWCSSSYYGQLPAWADAKNKETKSGKIEWIPTFPTEIYENFGESAPEPFKYTFDGKKDVADYKTSACMNDEITEMAISCLYGAKMGLDDIPDYLAVTYYAGNYKSAPMDDRPIEVQDIYSKLDGNISDLLKELDKRVGMKNVLVCLSSTGYVVEGETNDSIYKIPSGLVHIDRVAALLDVYLGAIFGKAKYIEQYHNSQIYLNRKLIEQMQLDKLDVISHAVEFLMSVDGVEDVFTIYRLGGMLSPELQYVKNGYNSSCSGDIWLRLMPGWHMAKHAASASNLVRRGAVNFPMVLYGNGITPEYIKEETPVNVLVPELARMLHIRRPNDNCMRIFR
ncbi:MAG: alkaline phosphatase family protein [Bacteroidaceae bacterium]|nr:alkaline phosphatase family protein [Bacteroidaceae bacterium]